MKIIYFPGFGGNKNSETFKKLNEKYPETQFIIYDNLNAENAFQQIQQQLGNVDFENILVIGQSLGGFWAEIFAIEKGWNLILINPSLEPHQSLKKYGLNDNDLRSFKKFIPYKKVEDSKITVILSKNDTVVNPKPVLEKYKNLKFNYIEGNHQLSNFSRLFLEIENLKPQQI